MTHILLTNDDGYEAPGLRALAAALEGFATVSIVAPSREQSGAAQSLTLRQPIVCHSIAEREWAIDGTPADCVIGRCINFCRRGRTWLFPELISARTWARTCITREPWGRPARPRCIPYPRWPCRC